VSPDRRGQEHPAGSAGPLRGEERFRSLFERRYSSIHSYVLRRVGSNGDAADVTAQVFDVAWRRLSSVPEPPADLPWLYNVARKLVDRHWRTTRRRRRLEARLLHEAGATGTPEDDADKQAEKVRAAIDGLRSADREVLKLIHWDQLSHADAAAVLGCSENAVALRLLRARRRLRAVLGGVLSPPPDTAGRAAGQPLKGPSDGS
jgi:RNA polymerase sigma-70 factor (ECF subfamily)